MSNALAVRFAAPLRGARLVDPSAPLPALPPRIAPPPPQTLWETEIGRELAQDREKIGATLARLAETIRALDERHRNQLAEWQRAAVELGVTIAARLLHDKVSADEMAVETVAREAVARLKTDDPVTVCLHPADVALLQERLGGEPLFPNKTHIQVIGDATLGRGDCRAEGKDATVLSELGAQLVALRQQLLENLANARP